MTSIFKYPHIEKLAGQPASVERIPKIHVTQIVVDYLARACSVEELQLLYPELTLSELYAVMTYYCDHQKEIENEIKLGTFQTNLVQQRPSLFGSDKEFIVIADDFNEPLEDFQDEQ